MKTAIILTIAFLVGALGTTAILAVRDAVSAPPSLEARLARDIEERLAREKLARALRIAGWLPPAAVDPRGETK